MFTRYFKLSCSLRQSHCVILCFKWHHQCSKVMFDRAPQEDGYFDSCRSITKAREWQIELYCRTSSGEVEIEQRRVGSGQRCRRKSNIVIKGKHSNSGRKNSRHSAINQRKHRWTSLHSCRRRIERNFQRAVFLASDLPLSLLPFKQAMMARTVKSYKRILCK